MPVSRIFSNQGIHLQTKKNRYYTWSVWLSVKEQGRREKLDIPKPKRQRELRNRKRSESSNNYIVRAKTLASFRLKCWRVRSKEGSFWRTQPSVLVGQYLQTLHDWLQRARKPTARIIWILLEGRILSVTFCHSHSISSPTIPHYTQTRILQILAWRFFACEGSSVYPATPRLRSDQSTEV